MDSDSDAGSLNDEVACFTAAEPCRFPGCTSMLLPHEHEEHCRTFYEAHLRLSLESLRAESVAHARLCRELSDTQRKASLLVDLFALDRANASLALRLKTPFLSETLEYTFLAVSTLIARLGTFFNMF